MKDIINNLRFLGGEFNYTGATGIGDFIVDYTNFTTNGAIRALSNTPNGLNGLCVTPVVVNNVNTFRRAGKCYAGNFNQGFGVLGLNMKTTDLNYFLQDDWRVTPRFTLNLGLRYSTNSIPIQSTLIRLCRKPTTKWTIATTSDHVSDSRLM